MQQLEKFNALVRDLEAGRVRVAERTDGEWKVNSWVKETILEGFRYGKLTDMSEGQFSFFDKGTESLIIDFPVPERGHEGSTESP